VRDARYAHALGRIINQVDYAPVTQFDYYTTVVILSAAVFQA
jgi:hypothetical protein